MFPKETDGFSNGKHKSSFPVSMFAPALPIFNGCCLQNIHKLYFICKYIYEYESIDQPDTVKSSADTRDYPVSHEGGLGP